MSSELTVMGGELGNIFWDLSPWIVYTPGYDLGCTIYVANTTETEKEYTLVSRTSSGETVISEEAIKVFGNAWFTVAPGDFVRLRGSLRSDESDVVMSILLVERESEEVADVVFTSLVAPTESVLPPTWPGTSSTGSSGFDWNSMLMMLFPVMILGTLNPDRNEDHEEDRENPDTNDMRERG
ncbi:MAG: hypothetical protein JW712_10370 [Dehalococcoidales bacterium]|nr:hypothetical protein [Dehalococcoidales bacterium]